MIEYKINVFVLIESCTCLVFQNIVLTAMCKCTHLLKNLDVLKQSLLINNCQIARFNISSLLLLELHQ
ncbi:hypothetical protein QVD17_02487 [Tagetes erecta]|uniref:SWIM-type domain-containing protein n=1 Tax=Tagetes erecta TaxID=13708 RepID=A0AAD8LFP9_TARER|nr:hypothetical protein QVD17_02487 [Tagetes erecta]